MKEKYETLEKFKKFKMIVESEVGKNIECLCTDNGVNTSLINSLLIFVNVRFDDN